MQLGTWLFEKNRFTGTQNSLDTTLWIVAKVPSPWDTAVCCMLLHTSLPINWIILTQQQLMVSHHEKTTASPAPSCPRQRLGFIINAGSSPASCSPLPMVQFSTCPPRSRTPPVQHTCMNSEGVTNHNLQAEGPKYSTLELILIKDLR